MDVILQVIECMGRRREGDERFSMIKVPVPLAL
jgi:hypothetical protein